MAAFGDDPHVNLEILIGQMVNLVRDGQPVRMCKRAGTVVTLDDLVDAIGVDATRYALARYSSDSPIDIDLELWARATDDNPVFTVQYAHARVASLMRNAAELQVRRRVAPRAAHPREGGRTAASARRVPAGRQGRRGAARAAPGGALPGGARPDLPPLLRHLSGAAPGRRGDHRPAPGAPAAVAATRTVIANGLALLGVSAPERM